MKNMKWIIGAVGLTSAMTETLDFFTFNEDDAARGHPSPACMY